MRFNPKARLDTGRVTTPAQRRRRWHGRRRRCGCRSRRHQAGGGIGGLILMLVIFVISQCSGVDITGGGGRPARRARRFDTSRVASDSDRYANCKTGADANEDVDCARIAVENSLQRLLGDEPARAGRHPVPRRPRW